MVGPLAVMLGHRESVSPDGVVRNRMRLVTTIVAPGMIATFRP
jgi:hypothetical protein